VKNCPYCSREIEDQAVLCAECRQTLFGDIMDVMGDQFNLDLRIEFFDEKNASIEIVDHSEKKNSHFGELLLFVCFALRQMHNLGFSNPVSQSMAEVLAFCGNPTRPLTILVGPHELSLDEVIRELKKGSFKPTKRFLSTDHVAIVSSPRAKAKKSFLCKMEMENKQLKFQVKTKGIPLLGPGVLYYVPLSVGILLKHLAESNSSDKDVLKALQNAAKFTGEILQSGKITALNQATLAFLTATRAFASSFEDVSDYPQGTSN